MMLRIGDRTAKRLVLCGAMIAAGWGFADSAEAQNVRRTFSAGAQGGGAGGGPMPFQNTYRRPAISAYNQISNFANNPQAAGNIYQQMVMPMQQQQQQQLEMMSQGRQVSTLQNQVQQIQRSTTARQFDESIRPTGHRATYMNYSHYYNP